MHRRRFFCAAFGCVATLYGSKPVLRTANEIVVPDSEYEAEIERDHASTRRYLPDYELQPERKAELVDRAREKFVSDASVAAATGAYFTIMSLPVPQ